jgi:hypothetical protein
MSSHGGVGETRISSIDRAKNFDEKNIKDVLAYDVVTIASMTSPGTTNDI